MYSVQLIYFKAQITISISHPTSSATAEHTVKSFEAKAQLNI
jgi:hypothetical protein